MAQSYFTMSFFFGRKKTQSSVQPHPEEQTEEQKGKEEDSESYRKYLEEATSNAFELAALRETGCVSQGMSKEGVPILFLSPRLGLPAVYLAGEV